MIYDILPKQFTWNDLRDTLNSHGGSVTNEGETAYLPSANLDKWSYYKPVRHRKLVGQLTDEELKSVNYGLEVPVGSTDPEIAITSNYAYLLPRKGIDTFRIDDFIGYNPKSTAPCIGVGDIIVDAFEASTTMLSFMYSMDFEGITMKSFEILQDKYLACVFTYYSGTSSNRYTTIKTSSKPISEGASNIFEFNLKTEAPFNVIGVRDITYYFLAARNKVVPGELYPPNTYYALPFKEDAPGTGNITIKTTPSYSCEFEKISRGANSLEYYFGIYIGLEIPGELSARFKIEPNGDCYLSGEINNKGNSPVTLYANKFTIEASSTFGVGYGFMQPTGEVYADLYTKNSQFEQYVKVEGHIQIPANTVMAIKIGAESLFSYTNGIRGNFYTGLEKSAFFTIKYNDKFIAGTPIMRLKS